jgi:hypothetical protein
VCDCIAWLGERGGGGEGGRTNATRVVDFHQHTHSLVLIQHGVQPGAMWHAQGSERVGGHGRHVLTVESVNHERDWHLTQHAVCYPIG